jgi:homoserine O-acetyltransferase
MPSQRRKPEDLQDGKDVIPVSASGVAHVQRAVLPAFTTESGFTFASVEVVYQTLGRLSAAKDNAILICHALSGNAHVAGLDETTGRPGWWDHHVGPGKAIDTDRYFVIGSNVLGGCAGTTGPASTDPVTGRPYGSRFPRITVRDMVAVQARLLDHLGIERLFATAGGSMGGMQALVWALDYPGRVKCCLPIASTSAHSARQIAFNEISRQAILADPLWRGGDYYDSEAPERGLAVARMMGHVTYLSDHAMTRKFGRERQITPHPSGLFPDLFEMESYLHHQGASFVRRFDANSLLHLTRAIDDFELFPPGPMSHVSTPNPPEFLVISFDSDWLYPPVQSVELSRQLHLRGYLVRHEMLSIPYGHDSFLIENPEFSSLVEGFLREQSAK